MRQISEDDFELFQRLKDSHGEVDSLSRLLCRARPHVPVDLREEIDRAITVTIPASSAFNPMQRRG